TPGPGPGPRPGPGSGPGPGPGRRAGPGAKTLGDRPGPDGDGQAWGAFQMLAINTGEGFMHGGQPLGSGPVVENAKPEASAGAGAGAGGGGSRPQPAFPTGVQEVTISMAGPPSWTGGHVGADPHVGGQQEDFSKGKDEIGNGAQDGSKAGQELGKPLSTASGSGQVGTGQSGGGQPAAGAPEDWQAVGHPPVSGQVGAAPHGGGQEFPPASWPVLPFPGGASPANGQGVPASPGQVGGVPPVTGQFGAFPLGGGLGGVVSPVNGQGASVSPGSGQKGGVPTGTGQFGDLPLGGGPGGVVPSGVRPVYVFPAESEQVGKIPPASDLGGAVPPMSWSLAAVTPESGHVLSGPPVSGPATAVPPGISQTTVVDAHLRTNAAKPPGSLKNGSQPTGGFKVKTNLTVDALELGPLVVLASMHRNLLSQSEARGDILTSLNHKSLPPAPRWLAHLFVERLVGLARAALAGPGNKPGWVPQPPAPNGRLLQQWDTAAMVLLSTQGEVNGVRGRATSAAARTVLAALATMSHTTADEEGLLAALNCEQLTEVLVQSTLGLPEGAAMGSPTLSTWNLSELLLVILGVELPAAVPLGLRTGVAALALTLYECVADNGKRPASSDKVEMVNRILVQRYRSPHIVSLQPRSLTNAQLLARALKRYRSPHIVSLQPRSLTNAQLLARALKGIPPVAAARVDAPDAVIPPPISPNPSIFPNRKMKEWRAMNLCTDLVLRLAGLQWAAPVPAGRHTKRLHIKKS
ncbi:Collagen alpha-5(VI) chain, partial [Frankliniella fusca]